MVTLEFMVDESDAEAFAEAMIEVQRMRRRDGARAWGLYRDTEDPRRHLEYFVVDSWAQHLRQHERTTVADRELQDHVGAFHRGPEPPVVSHLISASARGKFHG